MRVRPWLAICLSGWLLTPTGAHADARAEKRLLVQLAKAPNSEPLLLRYAELALPCDHLPSTTKARELLRQLSRAKIEPGRRLLLHAALAQAALAEFEASVRMLGDGVERLDRESAACARGVAALAIYADQLEPATSALGLAVEAAPQELSIRSELARLWLARGRADRALPLLAESFSSATGSLTVRSELAYALAADGRAEEALSLLAPAREACQHETACALLAARIALEAERLDDARSYLEALLAEQPAQLDALFALADVHTRAHRLQEARAAYSRILALRPESVRAAQALAALPP